MSLNPNLNGSVQCDACLLENAVRFVVVSDDFEEIHCIWCAEAIEACRNAGEAIGGLLASASGTDNDQGKRDAMKKMVEIMDALIEKEKLGGDTGPPSTICLECGQHRPDDDRVKHGMKCVECAYGGAW